MDSGGQAGGLSSFPCLLFEHLDLIGKDMCIMKIMVPRL